MRPLLILWLCCQVAISADLPPVHISNFHRVNDYVYRSGEPSTVGLQELGALDIKRVIDLREQGGATAFEKETLEKLGIKYTNIPFGGFSAPSDAQMQSVLRLLNDRSSPVLLHCWRGKDRTGTVIACYRIQHDGWDNRRALAEARAYGMSHFERGMQNYILRFSATSFPISGVSSR